MLRDVSPLPWWLGTKVTADATQTLWGNDLRNKPVDDLWHYAKSASHLCIHCTEKNAFC